MRHRPIEPFLMLILVLVLAAPVGAQQKPFSPEQVQGLIRDGIGDETGAKLIAQRGIDFTLTEDFLHVLKAAGASEAFLQALRSAKAPQTANAGTITPLTQVQVISLVAGEVPNHRVALLAQERGIDFEPGDEFFRDLRLAGGDDELVNALKSAKVTKPVSVDATLVAKQAEIQQHTTRGAQFLKNKQYPDAEAEYRAAIQLDPQNPDHHVNLGNVLGREGNWDGQVAEEREALRLSPNNDRAHLNLGVALSHKDDQEGAIAEYHEAIRLNPNNDQAHVNLGNRLVHQGDWEGGTAEYREAIRVNPKNDLAHVALGSTFEHRKDWDNAAAEYRAALQLNPNNDQTHINLGVALSQKDDQEGAIVEYREAIRLNPSNEQAHINLGNRLSHRNDWDGAIAEYREAVRLNSSNHAAHYNLGTAFEHQGNRQAALQEYHTAYDLNPKNTTYQKAYERLTSQAQ